jgi:anaerobic magnesium-protoporphyrin IX monomethyl ester cyclase
MVDVFLVQLPSPPRKNVFREWAGSMGTALPSARDTWGHDAGYYDIPYSAYLYIARRLQDAGTGFRYFDFQAQISLDLDAFDAPFLEHRPRVLVTQVNLPSLRHDLELVARARRLVPGLQVILVGAAGKWFRDRILSEGFAEAVMEEAEELLVPENVAALLAGTPEALQGCSVWQDGKAVSRPGRTPFRDLDFVDFPAYELLDFSRYESDYYFGTKQRYATVFTTKGCPYKCGYCPYPYGFGKRLIYRSPKRVADDIARLQRDFGVEQILFRDQVFTINPKHARAVCEELIARDLGIVWLCETRYDLADEELLDLMWRAGCREIHYGLESGDPEMFASVAKSDGPRSLDLFERAIGWTKARGMKVHLHLIVGMPDESRITLRNTTLWLRKVKPDSVQLAYFVPYPGTPMFDELNRSKELGDIGAIDWEDMGSFTDPVLPTRYMTIDQIRHAKYRLSVDWKYTLADRIVNRAKKAVGLR